MDPIRNPYAPGAGQRPPELAGRDRELDQFAVTLERVAAGRPDRSMVLSGLRGVGKTVLLNALRSLAVQRAWGTGKLEARPDQSVRLPLAQAAHAAVREIGRRHRDEERVDEVAAVHKAFALKTELKDRKGLRWQPPVEVVAARGRADSGDLELDLVAGRVAELAHGNVEGGRQRAAQPLVGTRLQLAGAPVRADRRRAKRVEQHRLPDPAQPGQHDRALRAAAGDPFEHDVEGVQLLVTAGQLGRALSGAGRVGVAYRVHDRSVWPSLVIPADPAIRDDRVAADQADPRCLAISRDSLISGNRARPTPSAASAA
jgi:hypothetical protein